MVCDGTLFFTGKGGVRETTTAPTIALSLAAKGSKVHLAAKDPAAHLDDVITDTHSAVVEWVPDELKNKMLTGLLDA